MNYVDVLLPLPLEGKFSYILPEPLAADVQVGSRVVVPFGAKLHYTGIVTCLHDDPPTDPAIHMKEVAEVIDTFPAVLPHQLRLWQWIADYYLCSEGDVLKAALGGGMMTSLGRKRRLRKDCADLAGTLMATCSPSQLTPAQLTAKQQILDAWQTHDVCLLHGVTSSGKTEVYIHLIEEAIQQGKQVLYMMPEIALTTQMEERLRRVFGQRLGIFHSRFSDAERAAVWRRQLSDAPYDVILGVRSAVFLPWQRLGLVIVDEEHENTYKQQDPAPRYHARNVAIVLAAQFGAKTLLGTATPSFESYYNARSGKYGLVTLCERWGAVKMPEIQVVDIRELKHKHRMCGSFSPVLLAAIRDALARGEQAILFQNRRGYAPLLECGTCGWVPRCARCDVSLTYHRRRSALVCHYCGAVYALPPACPACGESRLRSIGVGTERIEEELQGLIPEARIARMDLDTTQARTSYEQILSDFASGKTNILIGTQMVSKGLDFAHVSVVGIMNADTMLNYPDFRSHERAYQLMAQVAGRCGRRDRQGLVILQTRSTDLPVVSHVRRYDYDTLYAEQMGERQAFGYPPYTRLIFIYLRGRDVHRLDEAATLLRHRLDDLFTPARILGPEAPAVSRVSGLSIRKLMLKLEPACAPHAVRMQLRSLLATLEAENALPGVTLHFDADPM